VLSRDKRSERTPVLPRHQPSEPRLAPAGAARAAVRRPVVRLVEVDMLPAGLEAVALGLRSVVDEHVAANERLVPRQYEPVDPRLVRVRVRVGVGVGVTVRDRVRVRVRVRVGVRVYELGVGLG
jgi:hypothetical protein